MAGTIEKASSPPIRLIQSSTKPTAEPPVLRWIQIMKGIPRPVLANNPERESSVLIAAATT
jgi:hypothetical protein